jgi:hypothetical protein
VTAAIDKWGAEQGVEGRSEALRKLVELGLKGEGMTDTAVPTKRPGKPHVLLSGRVPPETAAVLDRFAAKYGIDQGEALRRCIDAVTWLLSDLGALAKEDAKGTALVELGLRGDNQGEN